MKKSFVSHLEILFKEFLEQLRRYEDYLLGYLHEYERNVQGLSEARESDDSLPGWLWSCYYNGEDCLNELMSYVIDGSIRKDEKKRLQKFFRRIRKNMGGVPQEVPAADVKH
ncbi:hypothetical protein GF367_01545 [Candidatus Woesearchaeota archaeon]|nr:hypothetical protein [Candidatus Woesearchaeota archaeon]